MQLTIDSTESLNDTLRVVGAIYNVTLKVSADAGGATSPTDGTGQTRSTATTKPRKTTAGTPRKRTTTSKRATGTPEEAAATNSAVRAWARQHGYAVADRGRIPADVVAAYRQSHTHN